MDGVLADWSQHFYNRLIAIYGNRNTTAVEYDFSDLEPKSANRTWDMNWENRTPAEKEAIERVKYEVGFYRSIPAIPGGKAALEELVAAGHDVWICTTPETRNPTCITDKQSWVKRELGEEWVRKIIFTHDKTIIHGDILIDDKPEITGDNSKPTWKQIVFEASYNQDVNRTDTRPRITFWYDAFDVVTETLWKIKEIGHPSFGALLQDETKNEVQKPRLIGIGGLLTSGKDTAADHLVEAHGFIKLNMGLLVSECLEELNPWVPTDAKDAQIAWQTTGIFTRYRDVVQLDGYDDAKKNPEVRRLLQRLGTDVGRNLLGENVWVTRMAVKISEILAQGSSIVVSGIRFANELDLITSLGGKNWWVNRPGLKAPTHASENSLTAKDFDEQLQNDSTLDHLYEQVGFFVKDLTLAFAKIKTKGFASGGYTGGGLFGAAVDRGHVIPRSGRTINRTIIAQLNDAFTADNLPIQLPTPYDHRLKTERLSA